MKKIILLLVSIITFNCYAVQAAEPDPVYAGTIWYNIVDGQLNHDSFIRFDKQVAICTLGFMGEGKPSQVFDYIYNTNDKNEILLCRLEEPMRPSVILTIHEDNTLEFNIVDLPVGKKFKKIQYNGISNTTP
ncbi:MAG: hypothetical protein LBV72_02790 [Tannerella sp.]|jgi:hypothetical protein|nr:hypothetical protein [Tannerella sp.]